MSEEQKQHAVLKDHEAALLREKTTTEGHLGSELSQKEKDVGRLTAELERTQKQLGTISDSSEFEQRTAASKMAIIERELATARNSTFKNETRIRKLKHYRQNTPRMRKGN